MMIWSVPEVVVLYYRELKRLIQSPAYYSAIRTVGVFFATMFVISSTPRWIIMAMDHHHFFGINVVIGVAIFLYQLWKKYISHIKITLFRGLTYGVHFTRLFVDNYLTIDPSERVDAERLQRRKTNRKHIRIAIMFLMVQHCLLPDTKLLWIMTLLAYKFVRDAVHFLQADRESIQQFFSWRASTEDTANNENQATDESHAMLENQRLNIKAMIVSHGVRLLFAATLLFRLFNYTSRSYVLVTLAYFLMSHKLLEYPLTLLLEFSQLDIFEGLEQYYAIGVLGFSEVFISFVFMTWMLVLHQQYLMLIALYTNIYISGKDVIQESVTSAIAEWTLLAHFERATSQELRELDDLCAICLANMRNARKTSCKHFFHGHCLRRWIKTKNACPICNKKLADI